MPGPDETLQYGNHPRSEDLTLDALAFRQELRRRLAENRERVVLRVVVAANSEPVELTGADILERAPALAAQYVQVPESGVVLLLVPHSLELFLLHFGLILLGRLPAILAWPTNRIDPEKYQRNLLHQLRHLPAHQLITLPRLAGNLTGGLHFPATACSVPNAEQWERAFTIPLPLEIPDTGAAPRPVDMPPDAVFLQFSGGTTGAQKAVVVTAPMLTAQLDRLGQALDFGQRDSVVSWLPMYHDMGLIACLWFPLWRGAPSLQFSATDWLLNPQLLFQFMERYRGTFCWLPNFAFSYLAALRGRMEHTYSLGGVRAWINCSEPVRLRSFREFAEAFAAWGVTMESLQASYAMAENIFAVTQTPLGLPPGTFPRSRLRQRAAELQEHAFDLLDDVYVSSGPVLEGMSLRVVNPQGELCAEAEPGNIQLRTECLFGGYWSSDGFLTESIVDGWYTTGDYGFLTGDHLYVIGRLKDIIIVGGQNIFPEDVESVVNSIDSIYPGRVVAFGVNDEQYGTERLAVVAELRGEFDPARAEAVERRVLQLVLTTIGIAPRYAAVVPERWIVKSTAGKISRRDTRVRFLRERLNQPQVIAG
jgi:acyl-CoA synthetase (AMP-forming)/AMP-acid ligase II